MTDNDEKDEDDDVPAMEDIAKRISFKVSARATEANKDTHKRFKQTAWDRHDGDYTETIRMYQRKEDELERLLKRDRRFDALAAEIEAIKQRLQDEDTEDKEEDDDGTF
jgi:hypothetical protein